jgi:short subunit dehydrogenase-like uncharacterized protein
VAEDRVVIAVLGATGYTGGLVLERARTANLPLRLVGRRPAALAEASQHGEEVRIADARDGAALREAFDGARVVVSLAGPFLETGAAPVQGAIDAGANYVDTSGEQAFARVVYEQYDEPARERGVALLTSFGFDFVPGDLAARIAAEGLEPVDEIVVAYAARRFAASAGTRRTIGRVMRQEQLAYENGVHVVSAFGATTRRVLPVRRADGRGVERDGAADGAAAHARAERPLVRAGSEGRGACGSGGTDLRAARPRHGGLRARAER